MFASMKYPTIWKVAALIASQACLTSAIAAPVKPTSTGSYIVKSGDTFAKIARQYGIGLGELLKANKLSNPDRITLGQWITIPGSRTPAPRTQSSAAAPRQTSPVSRPHNPRNTTVDITPPAVQGAYIVKTGDTLSKIHRQTGVPVTQLLKLNGLAESSTIRPGQTLRLNASAKVNPVRTVAPTPAKQPAINQDLPPATITDAEALVATRPLQNPAMPSSTSGAATHKVETGETVSSISRQYGIQTASLIAANHTVNPNKLKVGQTILIPGQPVRPQPRELPVNANGRMLASQPDPLAREQNSEEISTVSHTRAGYLVQNGESIEEIADRFACSPQDIRRLNRMSSADQIYPGRYILVPFNREAPRNNRYAKNTL